MKILSSLVALSFCFLAAPSFAVDEGAQMQKNIELSRAIISTEKQAIVTENMPLTAEEGKKFWPLYHEYQNEVRKLGDRDVNLITDYAKNYTTMTDEKSKQIMNRWMDNDEKHMKLRKKYVKKFSKILPHTKVTRYFQIENKMRAVIDAELAQDIPLMRTSKTTPMKKK